MSSSSVQGRIPGTRDDVNDDHVDGAFLSDTSSPFFSSCDCAGGRTFARVVSDVGALMSKTGVPPSPVDRPCE